MGFFLTSGLGNESYLKSSFHSNAKRTPKTRYQVRCADLDALRRGVFVASIPFADRFQASGLQRNSLVAAKQSLHCWRDAVIVSLSDDSRARAFGDNATSETERRLPVSDRTAELSGRDYTPTLSVASRTADVAAV